MARFLEVREMEKKKETYFEIAEKIQAALVPLGFSITSFKPQYGEVKVTINVPELNTLGAFRVKESVNG